jgi:ssDNA-binding Zn-finger/Zn-ribbon topoisomerase 1
MKFQDNSEVNQYCPNCVPLRKLIVKTNQHTERQFLGCPNWPDCDYTTEIPESMRMKAAGAMALPGFE